MTNDKAGMKWKKESRSPDSALSDFPLLRPLSFLLCPCLLLCVCAAAVAADWQADIRLAYDNNPFEYSAADLALFRSAAAPERFPIRTSDDLQASLSGSVLQRFRLAGRSGSLTLRTRLHQFVSNPEKSYGLATVEAGQSLWSSAQLRLSHLYLPRYLVRYYRDPSSDDTGDYTPCSFAEHLLSAGVRQRLGPVTVEPRYRYEADEYVRAFEHYNTRAHRPGLRLEWEPVSSFVLGGDYEYKLASARGPVPDISYDQHEVALSVRSRPRRLTRFGLEAGYAYAHRAYTTANGGEVDPSHAGRVDVIEKIEIEGRYRLAGPTIVAGYEYEWREVSSSYSSSINDVKDYRAHRFSLGVVVSSRRRGDR